MGRRLISCLILCLILIVFTASSAKAEIVFAPAFSYRSAKVDDDPDTTKELILSARLGYLFTPGWYLGGHYSRKSVGSGDTELVQDLYGVSGGFVKNGWNIILTYFASGKEVLNSGDGYTGASGPQVDVGWYGDVGNGIGLGPQITWNSIDYKKAKVGSIETDTDHKVTSVRPMIALWFMF